MSTIPMTAVEGLGRKCSYPTDVFDLDRACGRPATSCVEDPDKGAYDLDWRCDEHTGRLDDGQYTRIFTTVPTDMISRLG